MPGAIYKEGVSSPVIQPDIHLGLTVEVDIDAFELAWLPDESGNLYLALLFSVDEDDPRTETEDESGGYDPATIYASFLDGSHFELVRPRLAKIFYGNGGVHVLYMNWESGGSIQLLPRHDGGMMSLACNSRGELFAIDDNVLTKIIINNRTIIDFVRYTLDDEIFAVGASFDSRDTLYAINRVWGSYDSLVRINTDLCTITTVGTVDRTDLNCLAFDPSGRLWTINQETSELCELDPSTGAIISSAVITMTGGDETEYLCLDFDGAGRMYTGNTSLWEIVDYHTSSPQAVLIGPVGPDYTYGLAIYYGCDDIDAIAVSEDDLYSEILDLPIIYQR
jgi:hypothetical protein